MWTRRESWGREAAGPVLGSASCEAEGFPSTVCVVIRIDCVILAHAQCVSVFVFCHLLRSERPCLHIELFIRTLRTRSCLFRCLIGICWRLSSSLPANLTYLISLLTSPMKDCHFVQKVKNKIDHHQNILNNIINIFFFSLLDTMQWEIVWKLLRELIRR